jgi:hypothetical protein
VKKKIPEFNLKFPELLRKKENTKKKKRYKRNNDRESIDNKSWREEMGKNNK